MNWYAIYTKPRHEKAAVKLLTEKEFETYLPLIKKVRQWKDRKKKIEMPLFNSYIFVNFDYKNRFNVLETHGVVKIINFGGTPAIIPNWQIESLRQMLDFPDSLQLEQYIKPGEIVEITDGPMSGMRGMVVTKKSSKKLVLSIEGIFQSVSVQVEEIFVKKVLKEKN